MDTVTYPQEDVARFVTENFIPVRVPVDEHPDLVKRYRVPWTPTLLVLGADGTEHYRDTGYLPPAELLARLHLALARVAYERFEFEAAAEFLERLAARFPESELVPEALYFLGVARARSGKPEERRAIWKRILEKYPASDWAKKVSFAFERRA